MTNEWDGRHPPPAAPSIPDLETQARAAFATSSQQLPIDGRDVGPFTWYLLGFKAAQSAHVAPGHVGEPEAERCGCDESKRLEAERDEAYDSARSMQLRLERVVEGSKALRERLARLESGA